MESRASKIENRVRGRWARMLELVRRESETYASGTEVQREDDVDLKTELHSAPFQDSRKSSSGLGDKSGFWLL